MKKKKESAYYIFLLIGVIIFNSCLSLVISGFDLNYFFRLETFIHILMYTLLLYSVLRL